MSDEMDDRLSTFEQNYHLWGVGHILKYLLKVIIVIHIVNGGCQILFGQVDIWKYLDM